MNAKFALFGTIIMLASCFLCGWFGWSVWGAGFLCMTAGLLVNSKEVNNV